ncbi:MAG: hypothetical protein RIN55_10515 [Tissierellaceae bacterium]|nr:hypothetical protein [Tissierellaceae bacterium]
MKRFLFLIITLFSILLLSCTPSDTKIIEKIDKLYNDNEGYETTLKMKIINDSKETIYKMKEKYIRNDVISLEILEPAESQGITIEYKDDKIFLNHASIRQSISLKTVKDFDKGVLLANFFENLNTVKTIEKREIDGNDYYIIEYSPDKKNKYNNERLIYLKKKNLEPYKMEIKDSDGITRVIIEYINFNYTKEI